MEKSLTLLHKPFDNIMKRITVTSSIFIAICLMAQNPITSIDKGHYIEIKQSGGPTLGYHPGSGVRIIEREGYAFKSFDGSDSLLPYEDWRLPAEQRAADLASRLNIREIAGLMLYSSQNKLPMLNDTYDGKAFAQSGCVASDLSDGQRKFLMEDNVRHVLVSTVESPVVAARWNNNVQALIEGTNHGIPANNSSDPRHSAFADAEFAPGGSGQLSLWSNLLGLAACFDPSVVYEFARTMQQEYRALGLATALSPQADLGTDPRWYRFSSTFGNDPKLVADITKAYCEGLQTSDNGGWGPQSVNAMVKHWPGGGSGEGGRDAHYGNGKYAVYPGGAYEQHKIPFLQGAFNLDGGTSMASAVMPYYTISTGHSGENAVGNSYSREIIQHQLREQANFDGVICTDWAITWDQIDPGKHSGKPWGVETLSEAERHFKALEAGVDQFGGNNVMQPVLDAYQMWVEKYGEKSARERFETSARRLLLNIFRTGLFENPYVDIEATQASVGSSELMAKGYEQQLKSIIMLKNANSALPLPTLGHVKVYVPHRDLPAMRNYWGGTDAARSFDPVAKEMAEEYYCIASPEEADVAIVFMDSPKSYRMGYNPADVEAGGNGYIPISLQYRSYTATAAREHSLAADEAEGVPDRTYRNKTAYTQNECDLDVLEQTRRALGDKPVIVVLSMANPTVMSEIEPIADAILVGFSVQTQAYLDIIFGKAIPSGLLPFEMPASMEAVEIHSEDMPHDIEPYKDSEGNKYKFGFGLDFDGVISDMRISRYVDK